MGQDDIQIYMGGGGGGGEEAKSEVQNSPAEEGEGGPESAEPERVLPRGPAEIRTLLV